MKLVKVISTQIKNSKLFVKILGFGKSDVQTPIQITPYGIDSNPIKDMVAIQGNTTRDGKTFIIGYINKNNIADIGELRLFATDSNGVEQSYIYVKNDGVEINGRGDFAVRHLKLNTNLQSQVVLINAELAKISAAMGLIGGAYTVLPITLDISQSKVDNVILPKYIP